MKITSPHLRCKVILCISAPNQTRPRSTRLTRNKCPVPTGTRPWLATAMPAGRATRAKKSNTPNNSGGGFFTPLCLLQTYTHHRSSLGADRPRRAGLQVPPRASRPGVSAGFVGRACGHSHTRSTSEWARQTVSQCYVHSPTALMTLFLLGTIRAKWLRIEHLWEHITCDHFLENLYAPTKVFSNLVS
jgi:hypothetical protein